MALIWADRVKETTTTTGTGAVNLAGASTGFRQFDDVMDSSDLCYYTIVGGTEWEVGLGLFTAGTPDTLTRFTVLDSSNAGAAVNLSAGTKDVFLSVPAALVRKIPNSVAVLTFTASDTYAPSNGLVFAKVTLQAPGGGGGGADTNGVPGLLRGAGGGGGEYAEGFFQASDFAATETVTIGAVGAAGALAGGTGGTGGTSSLGTLITAVGGGGGTGTGSASASTADRAGGAGGTGGTGGDWRRPGEVGGVGMAGTLTAPNMTSNRGGNSHLGYGAPSPGTGIVTGLAAGNYGGGGSGGAESGTAGRAGGAGGPGIMRIEEYISTFVI